MSKSQFGSARVFHRAWVRSGKPHAIVVCPIEDWDIPDGINPSPSRDAFLDANGDVVDHRTFWKTEYVRFIPNFNNEDEMVMEMAGVAERGATDIIVLKGSCESLQSAFRVLLEQKEYNVGHIREHLPGRTDWAFVRLEQWI